MIETENIEDLATALVAFQAELPTVGKDNLAKVKTDKANYTYRYADLGDLSPVVLPLLAKHGLAWMTQPTLNDQGHLMLRYRLMHGESGQWAGGDYPLPPASSTPQVIGSAITYARRYALCAVTGVAPGGDDDDAAAAQSPRRTPVSDSAAWVAGVVDLLLVVDNEERATAGYNTVVGSEHKDTNVSGLLTPDDRDTLGVSESHPLTLAELSVVVVGYVSSHKRAVRSAAAEPVEAAV